MNKSRKSQIFEVEKELQDIVERVESIKDEEEEAKCNLEDYPQFENRMMDMEMSIDSLEEAITSLNEVITALGEARNV